MTAAPTAMAGLEELAGLRVLLCNWRDTAHDQAGGAEAYCQRVGEALAAAGACVTLVTAAVEGRPSEEVVDGVRVLRRGSSLSVYLHVALHMLRTRSSTDAVVDFQNGIPFFAPLFVRRGAGVLAVVHHVHQDQFALHFPWALARLGRWLEGPVSRLVYRRTPVVVVSPSTREDVRRRLGFVSELHVVPNGTTTPPAELPAPAPASGPRIVLVTRLVPQKRVERVVEAMPALLARHPGLHLDVVGRGPSAASVAAAARRCGVEDSVTLHGFVDDRTRDELLAGASLTVTASVAEGWGLTVVEANSLGVPCVAYDVPGLRDAVVPGRTGWLADPSSDLADAVADALDEVADPGRRAQLQQACRTWAAGFTWDRTAHRVAALLVSERRRLARGQHRRRPTDLSTVAVVTVDDPTRSAAVRRALEQRLRLTDVVGLTETGAVRALLVGSDEAAARGALGRAGVPAADVSFRVALSSDYLVGAGAPGAAPTPTARDGR